MKARNLVSYIVGGFALGTMILLAIQYVTTAHVRELISGNEKLLREFNLTNGLIDLQKDLLVSDNTLKNAVITGDSGKMSEFQKDISKVQRDVKNLRSVGASDTTKALIVHLDELVDQKLHFNNQIAESLYHNNKKAAENLIATKLGNRLSDSITFLSQKIDTSGQIRLSQNIMAIDKTGRKVVTWNYFIIILVLLIFAFVFLIVLNRMKKQGELIGQLNTSEKKLKEAALVKENFLANMSHEIRTPLNAIIGYTNLLERKQLDPDARLYVSTVQKSGENLLSIVNDILDLSKIEAGMMRIEETAFSLRSLLHSVETMFVNKINEKGLKFQTNIDSEIPDTLLGDPTRLTQILVNLIGNAVKFTNKGKIALELTGQSQPANLISTIVFRITDTGIGIEKKKLESIFERFNQAEDATTRKYGGTGLGLSIVRDLIQLQNGTILVESGSGMGTTVTFSIPYKIAQTEILADPSDKPMIPDSLAGDLRILVAEDNEINQGLIAHILGDRQVAYRIVKNGSEVLNALSEEKFDMILMDIQMPDMDGFTATREIREKLKMDIPIVAMTAHAMPGQREKCIRYGMNDHISKPIREDVLWRVIAKHAAPRKDSTSLQFKPTVEKYKTIDLNYLREISRGDKNYERLVTGQFLELFPQQMELLEKAIDANLDSERRRIAHNLKTTISIMGLNHALDDYLDVMESETGDKNELKNIIGQVREISEKAMREAKHFLETLHSNTDVTT
jgi:signal transduction histidine kinase/DNA-binding response OmpR family regulator